MRLRTVWIREIPGSIFRNFGRERRQFRFENQDVFSTIPQSLAADEGSNSDQHIARDALLVF